jgi:hypothetical protein
MNLYGIWFLDISGLEIEKAIGTTEIGIVSDRFGADAFCYPESNELVFLNLERLWENSHSAFVETSSELDEPVFFARWLFQEILREILREFLSTTVIILLSFTSTKMIDWIEFGS